MAWTKRDRVMAVLSGEVPDRPPVTAYRHFPGMEFEGKDLARVMVDFQNEYDWDWIKINCCAVYYYEQWGNQYDYNNYEGNVPHRESWAVHSPADLARIGECPGDSGAFARQLESIRLIRAEVGLELPVIQTVFSPIAVLLNLCGGRSPGRYRPAPREECVLLNYFREHREQTHQALKNIARSLADYASHCVKAGADGIFFAEMGLAREGYLTFEEWKEFIEPYDLIVLEGTDGHPSILHTCGIYGNPGRFLSYPIQALHWAESAPGNPPIAGSEKWLGKIAAMGGVDERLFGTGAEDKIAAMARASVAANRGRPFLLAPECTVDMTSSPAELKALREAAER